jgi:hypothetical protein
MIGGRDLDLGRRLRRDGLRRCKDLRLDRPRRIDGERLVEGQVSCRRRVQGRRRFLVLDRLGGGQSMIGTWMIRSAGGGASSGGLNFT